MAEGVVYQLSPDVFYMRSSNIPTEDMYGTTSNDVILELQPLSEDAHDAWNDDGYEHGLVYDYDTQTTFLDSFESTNFRIMNSNNYGGFRFQFCSNVYKDPNDYTKNVYGPKTKVSFTNRMAMFDTPLVAPTIGAKAMFINKNPVMCWGQGILIDENYNVNSNVTFNRISWESIDNKPTLFDGSYASLTNKPTMFDGSYNSLSDKPALFDGDYNNLTNKPTSLTPSSHTHSATQITGLATVATSGNYQDLNHRMIIARGKWTGTTGSGAFDITGTGEVTFTQAHFSYADTQFPAVPAVVLTFYNSGNMEELTGMTIQLTGVTKTSFSFKFYRPPRSYTVPGSYDCEVHWIAMLGSG